VTKRVSVAIEDDGWRRTAEYSGSAWVLISCQAIDDVAAGVINLP